MLAPGLSLASRGDMSPRLRFGGMHCLSHSPSRPDAVSSPRSPDPGAAKVCRAGPWPCVPSVLSTATCLASHHVSLSSSLLLLASSPPQHISLSPHLSPSFLLCSCPLSLVPFSRGPLAPVPSLPRLAGHLQLRWSAPLVCACLRNGVSVNKDVTVICAVSLQSELVSPEGTQVGKKPAIYQPSDCSHAGETQGVKTWGAGPTQLRCTSKE